MRPEHGQLLHLASATVTFGDADVVHIFQNSTHSVVPSRGPHPKKCPSHAALTWVVDMPIVPLVRLCGC